MLAAAPLITLIPSTDAVRARAFYEGTLGLPLLADDPFALVFGVGGTTLRVTKLESFVPQPFAILGWNVTDIRGAVSALVARGVTFERYPGMEQDELGVWSSPGGAAIAWFKDPEGNVLSLVQAP